MSKRNQFKALREVFIQAEQHARSKGNERHAATPDQPFEDQPICTITRHLDLGFPLGQAWKKILESQTLKKYPGRAKAELLGAINYIAAAIIVLDEGAVIASKQRASTIADAISAAKKPSAFPFPTGDDAKKE